MLAWEYVYAGLEFARGCHYHNGLKAMGLLAPATL